MSGHEPDGLLGAVVDTVDAGLLVLDEDGSFRWMNPALARMRTRLGQDGVERAGVYVEVWEADRVTRVPPDLLPSARAARGETFADETYWFGPQGADQIAARVSARRLEDADGRPQGALVVYQDVTALMIALEARDEFVASVSHELRTPLTSIIGYVELLEDTVDLPPTATRQLDVVGRNAERLLALVTDLLTVAQAEGGSMQIRPVLSDLGEIVERSMLSAQVRADAQGVTLRTRLDPIPPLPLDPVRIAQVVDNLVSNAIKYTPSGGAVTASVTADGDDAVLTVADTGIGIGDDDQGALFTKFFRAREVERRAIPGVGLGLAISRAIVERHGGRISVDSVHGEGTTVVVRLHR